MNILNKIIKNKFFEPSARILLCYLIASYLSIFIGFLFWIIFTSTVERNSGLESNFSFPLACISTAYFVMKICGIFKIIKDKNIFKEILKYCLFVLIIITLISINFLVFHEGIKEMNNSLEVFLILFDAVFVYPMYKIFEFLTKKFKFFQKFGYFVSYRFYKDMFLKLKNKLSKK